MPILGPASPLFIFGGAPVFLALVALGPAQAVAAYAVSQAVVPPAAIVLWVIPVYLLEVLGVALVYRKTGSLCFSVALYWLGAGWVVDLVVYMGLMGLDFDYTVLVFVKQLLGGLMNALAAEGLLMLWRSPPVRRLRGLGPEVLPLQAYVFRPVMFAVLFSTTVVALIHLRSEHQVRVNADVSRLAEEAAELVMHLERLGLAREEALGVFVTRRQRFGSPALWEAVIEDFHREHPEFLNLFVTDASGRAIATSPRTNARGASLRGVSLAGRAYWQYTRDTLRPGYSPLVLGTLHVRDASEPEPVLPLAIALTDDEGRFAGALVASLDGRELAKMLRPRAGAGEVTLLDSTGAVVASTDPDVPAGLRAASFLPAEHLTQARHVFTYAPGRPDNQLGLDVRRAVLDTVVRSGWKVLVETRIDTTHGAMMIQSFATLALVLLMIAPLYLVFARLNDDLVRPLIALDALAGRISASPEGLPAVPAPLDPDLAEAPVVELRRLAENLVSTERAVSHRVRQTAGDLATSLERLRIVNQATNDTVWDWDLLTGEVIRNDGLERLVGFTEAEAQGEVGWWEAHLHAADAPGVLSSLRAAIEGAGDRWHSEYRLRRKDGSHAWVDDQAFIVRDSGGRAVRMLGAMAEITARKQAEASLVEAEAQLRQLIESAQVALWRLNSESHLPAFVSPETEPLLGYPRERWLTDPDLWRRCLHPADQEVTIALFRRKVAEGRDFQIEHRIIRADGEALWLRNLVRVVTQPDGSTQLIGAAIDITPVRAAAEKDAELRVILEEAALEWERTFDAIEGPVMLVDGQDLVVRSNRGARSLPGSDPEPFALGALTGMEPWRTVLELVTEMRGKGAPARRDAGSLKDRAVWDVSVFPRAVLEPGASRERGDAVVVIRDVTGERQISGQREFLTRLWTALSEVTNLTEATSVILRHLCEFSGCDAGQVFVLNQQGTEFRCVPAWFGPESARPWHEASLRASFPVGGDVPGWMWAGGEARVVEDFPEQVTPPARTAALASGLRSMMCIPVRSGQALVAMVELFWREGHGPAVTTRDFLGAAVSQFGALIERHRTQAALHEQERSHSILLSNLSGMAYRAANDSSWTMTYVSDGCVELTGYDAAALRRGHPSFADLVEPADREWAREKSEASLKARRPCASEYRIRTAAGIEKWVWDQAQGVYGENGELEAVEGFISDITQRKQAEAELQRATTMGAMGALVAGVAHEVRNPLFAISANIDAFEARFGARPEFSGTIDSLRQSLKRMIVLMDDLLEYGRPTLDRLDPTDAVTVVRDAVAICADLGRQSGVEVTVKELGIVPRAGMDRTRMVAVFKNLIENAIQHTPRGGRVEVALATTSVGEAPHVGCWVRDCGPGFAMKDLPQVFEPFFTRRRGGSGLGLAIVQRIVHAHGGAARASNRPSGGAELLVCLPACAE